MTLKASSRENKERRKKRKVNSLTRVFARPSKITRDSCTYTPITFLESCSRLFIPSVQATWSRANIDLTGRQAAARRPSLNNFCTRVVRVSHRGGAEKEQTNRKRRRREKKRRPRGAWVPFSGFPCSVRRPRLLFGPLWS